MTVAPRMTIAELAPRIRSREISPVELAAETFRRIRQHQPALNAYITITEESAMEHARQAEREIASGRYRGPLHGIPYAAKDLFCTKGVATTAGSKLLRNFVPDYDAAVIERLRGAGAILTGKTGLHEWAYGITSNNPHFGAVRNPWDISRIPGGSSGGSTAALAAGMCVFALGSDTGGSIRIPASFCGLAGLKPTFGRISRYGALPLCHTLDHAGHFGLSVRDVALIFEALSGYDPRDAGSANEPAPHVALPAAPSLRGIRIGVPRNYFFDRLQPDVDSAVRAAIGTLGDLGAEVEEVELPDFEEITVLTRLVQLPEASALHRERLRTNRADFGADVAALLDQGQFVPATDYLDAQRRRKEFIQQLNAVFNRVQVIVTPTTPATAPKIGETVATICGRDEDVRLAGTRLVRALNFAGVPALSVPCGFDALGLPVGMQIFARAFDEPAVLLVGHAYEQATEWHKKTPGLG